MTTILNAAFPFSNIEDERLYRLHKLYAESYVTNVRNLEAPWKPVVSSVLDAIVQRVREETNPSLDIAIQQEQPLAPPALAAASVYADSTMTSSKHKGTVYPDISVIRYLVDNDNNFRTLTRSDMGHDQVDYLICAELKRSIKRAFIAKGLTSTDPGYKSLSTFLRHAAFQAARQAFVAVKRPTQANSDIILVAASGPFWMWCLPSRSQLLGGFLGMDVEDVLDAVQYERDEDMFEEQIDYPELDDGSSTSLSSALHSPMRKEDIFKPSDYDLPWSEVVMFDTKESEAELRLILKALIIVLKI